MDRAHPRNIPDKFRTMYAKVLKFHVWIPHEKIGDPYFFFFFELSPILELFPFLEIILKSRQQYISKSVWATSLLFDILIATEEEITWLNFQPGKWNVVEVIALCNFWPFNLVALLWLA